MNNSKNKTTKVKAKNPIKQLLDENNNDNIILFDDDGNKIEFEQVALIPLDSTNVTYAILIPITPMQGVADGEGVLFAIDEENEQLEVINDEKIIDQVLTIYQQLIEEGEGTGK